MKVTNLKITKFIAYFQLLLIFSLILIILYIQKIIPCAVLGLIVILCLYNFKNLRTVSFEYAGGCITVRKSHPLTYRKFISPEFELPTQYIRNATLDKNIFRTKIKLNVKTSRERKYLIKIILIGLNYKDNVKLQKTFSSLNEKLQTS